MQLEALDTFTAGVGLLHVGLGAVFVYGVFAAVERSTAAALLFSVGFVLAVLAAHSYVGNRPPALTWPEFKGLIWAAAIGTAIGGGFIAMFWEPALERRTTPADPQTEES